VKTSKTCSRLLMFFASCERSRVLVICDSWINNKELTLCEEDSLSNL
jgi:hypothetical protein